MNTVTIYYKTLFSKISSGMKRMTVLISAVQSLSNLSFKDYDLNLHSM